MSTIAPVTGSGAAGAAGVPGASNVEETQDRFLKLLVAQMKNQDPLNPLDNAQVTAQMAQISTVNGIERLNATLQAFAGSFGEAQALQAAALIGRDVLVPGASIELGAQGGQGGFQLAEPADRVVLSIQDASGAAVHRVDLGAQPAGVHAFQWDGANDAGVALAPGRYRFAVSAERGSAKPGVETLAAARVLGVTREAAGVSLNLSSLGAQPYAAVKQIL